jgi:serine O-acetyltransferase
MKTVSESRSKKTKMMYSKFKTPAWMSELVDAVCASYREDSKIDALKMPSKDALVQILTQSKQVLFPGYFGTPSLRLDNVRYFAGEILTEIAWSLSQEIFKAFMAVGHPKTEKQSELLAQEVLEEYPQIRLRLKKDVQAALDGDPAAKSVSEVILSYPCVEVIATHRIAHELYRRGIPLLPRILSEHAHSKWGVDIHPGASIGEYFFIDHGTGVVIGETTVIGARVKIYQGVTLGALSFPRDKTGSVLKNVKRHPTIEDRVTIYANATILGGQTVIGKDAVIGGNAWIVKSVLPGMKVKTS